jgi:8-oxo-dGTP diphosphatase
MITERSVYVLGFLFSPDYKRLVLIKKNKPDWQKDLFNVPGGRLEDRDKTYYHAVRREFYEETGLDIPWGEWCSFAGLTGSDYIVHCFVTCSEKYQQVFSATSETIEIYEVNEILTSKLPIVPSLAYLIPLARDYLMNAKHSKYATFTY